MDRNELRNVILLMKKDLLQSEVAIDIFSNAINSDISDNDLENLIYNTNINENHLFVSLKSDILMVCERESEQIQEGTESEEPEDNIEIDNKEELDEDEQEDLQDEDQEKFVDELPKQRTVTSLKDSLRNIKDL